ncbi:MAG: hypothetical protein NC191_03885 [Muribaculaceae bacterium]|nr:hypothetical protein [Muribaculaceae bacterium]
MIENFEKIKQYVLTLGEFEDSPKFDLQIQMIIDEILAYCYRDDVPQAMELPLADVIVNEIKTKGLLGFDGEISSYSEGDMSVSFGNSSSSSSSNGGGKYFGKLDAFKQIIGVLKTSDKNIGTYTETYRVGEKDV